jgi:hypothetical protein
MAKKLQRCSTSPRRISVRVLALLLLVLLCGGGASAYSVVTHEEIMDLVWTDEIRPLLLNRFPGLTEARITEAHSYVYGGALTCSEYPWYDRIFVKPHTQIECDPAIWNQVDSLIRTNLASVTPGGTPQ